MTAPRAYGVVVLGVVPAILSELVWYLTRVEERTLLGLEVWTTGAAPGGLRSGEAALTDTLRDHPTWWPSLRAGVADRVPAAPADLRAAPPPSRDALRRLSDHPPPTWTLGLLRGADGATLDDIRSAADAARCTATLHDRVRDLRTALPADVPLIGCLAGGRKTLSAALQTAFSLQGRAIDRLVHVLVHPALEAAVADPRRQPPWFFPTGPWSTPDGAVVAPEDQVDVYDIPFPPLHTWLPAGERGALDTAGYDGTLSRAREVFVGAVSVALVEVGTRFASSWTLTVASPHETLLHLTLTARQGGLYAALITARSARSHAELLEQLQPRYGLRSTPDAHGLPDPQGVRQLTSRLRAALQPLATLGLGDLIPTGDATGVRVPGRDRVTVATLR